VNAPTKIVAAEHPLSKLRDPFPDHQISKLPKESKAQADQRKADRNSAINCSVCGGWHHKNAVHLDYVGHAALTDRLLDTDIEWSWEPVAFNAEGLPALDRNGGLWIRLTVGGVTRLGYGAADGKSGGDAIKEIIGDALRNAAMRFGAALDLWHKGDLHVEEDATAQPVADAEHKAPAPAKRETVKLAGPYTSKTALWNAVRALDREIRGCGDSDQLEALIATEDAKAILDQCHRDAPQLLDGGDGLPAEFMPLRKLIDSFRAEFSQADDGWRTNPVRGG
jgi:hypothetical protein